MAAVKLSLRWTWHNSCARTASNWAGVRCSVMPSGSSKTGFTMPTTPGSRRADEDITGIGRFRSRGVAARRTARIWRHGRSQKMTPIAMPQSHTPNRMAGNGFWAGNETADKGAWAGIVKGWLISSIAKESCEGAVAGAVRHPSWAPATTRSEKGTRNFTDAASQIQYRTEARFFRSASVNSHATAANRVDC